ncbi:DNA-binding protein [uncultured Pseudodesulfovibrio sp.]|uniref:DNA-binding protein n=1 Tax=uncultured Pseudodesulfovibrio sp. TaxID=2035858 RepID=UPI0029C97E66|nr:DNA-binding protein [uncultured Pseudodesulfovibrio sp.]
MDNFCLKGARNICEAVGENPKNMHELVKDYGLPAWKREIRGTWRALPDDLKRWLREQRDLHLNEYRFKGAFFPDEGEG